MTFGGIVSPSGLVVVLLFLNEIQVPGPEALSLEPAAAIG